MSLSSKYNHVALAFTAFIAITTYMAGPAGAHAAPPASVVTKIKPEVLALIKQSTDTYKKYKSYSADIVLKTDQSSDTGSQTVETRFLLALDRPNRFCYRDLTEVDGTAAVSNGKEFINYKSDRKQYMNTPTPTDFKQINIVDDVQFDPLATYFIALMLRGDALADRDVEQSLEKATMGPIAIEAGKKLQILHLLFGTQEEACDLYFAEDHTLVKSTLKAQLDQFKFVRTETLKNIKTDGPIDPATFIYKAPSSAKKVDRFTAPQRAGDVNLIPKENPTGVRLASFDAPPIPGFDPAVMKLIQQASEAYGKLNTYRHTAVFRARGTDNGKPVDQSARFSLAVSRPNKFSFKMVSKPSVAEVSDGKVYTDFRSGEYTQVTAPEIIKGLKLDQDDFDPVAGTYMISLLLQNNAISDGKMLGILLKSSLHSGIVVDQKTVDALDFPLPDGLKFTLYFDSTTHMLLRAAAKVPDSDLILTETFEDVQVNKPIADSVFTYAPPTGAKKVKELSKQ